MPQITIIPVFVACSPVQSVPLSKAACASAYRLGLAGKVYLTDAIEKN